MESEQTESEYRIENCFECYLGKWWRSKAAIVISENAVLISFSRLFTGKFWQIILFLKVWTFFFRVASILLLRGHQIEFAVCDFFFKNNNHFYSWMYMEIINSSGKIKFQKVKKCDKSIILSIIKKSMDSLNKSTCHAREKNNYLFNI